MPCKPIEIRRFYDEFFFNGSIERLAIISMNLHIAISVTAA